MTTVAKTTAIIRVVVVAILTASVNTYAVFIDVRVTCPTRACVRKTHTAVIIAIPRVVPRATRVGITNTAVEVVVVVIARLASYC